MKVHLVIHTVGVIAFLHCPSCCYVTKQSHTLDDYGSSLAVDGDIETCASTGTNRGAWWMRSWDNPVTFHSIKLIVKPPISYFEVHSGDYSHPINHPIRSNTSLCARIDGSDTPGRTNYTIRCINTRQATALSIQLVGSTRDLNICEVDTH